MLPTRNDTQARRRNASHASSDVLKPAPRELPLPYNPAYVLAAVVLIMIFVVGVFFLFGGPAQSTKIPSPYVPVLERHKKGDVIIEVLEDRTRGYRLLRANKCILGGSWLADGSTIFVHNAIQSAVVYLRSLQSVPIINKNYLVIGLGTGHVASALQKNGWRGEVVEINPKIFEFAGKYFGYHAAGKAFVEDGTQVMKRLANSRKYAAIIQDVFDGKVNGHLHTKTTFERAKGILVPGGVYVLSIFTSHCCSLERTMLARSTLITLQQVFEHVSAFTDGAADHDPANIIYFASSQAIEFDTEDIPELSSLETTAKSFHKKWDYTHKLQELEVSARGTNQEGVIITEENKYLITEWNQIAMNEYAHFLPHLFPNISWT